MTAPVFELASADPTVVALLKKGSVLRLFMFGEAPEDVDRPYVVWQTAGGSPENLLSGVPNMDIFRIQVDVYADQVLKAREVTRALRDALEPHAYIVSWNFEGREPETRLYRVSFNVEFMTPRETLGS